MSIRLFAIIVILFLGAAVMAQDFEVDWFTIDGGGAMSSAGGEFEIGASIGQHDAGPQPPMAGGDFSLTGGFWTIGGTGACALPGDMNLDGAVNADDVQEFVNCLFGIGDVNCACADLDGGGISTSDIDLFVTALLST